MKEAEKRPDPSVAAQPRPLEPIEENVRQHLLDMYPNGLPDNSLNAQYEKKLAEGVAAVTPPPPTGEKG